MGRVKYGNSKCLRRSAKNLRTGKYLRQFAVTEANCARKGKTNKKKKFSKRKAVI